MTSVITNFGVSEELQGIFYSLREMPSLKNSELNKFKKHEIDNLSQNIVCRNYGKLCLELSYLCFAIINYSNPILNENRNTRQFSPLLNYFWLNENLSKTRIQNYFNESCIQNNKEIALEGNGLKIKVEQTQFDIALSRVGLLAALLEFILYIKPQILNELESSLVNADTCQIKESASSLQKLIYQFLTHHLSSAQAQRRFRFMANYLDDLIQTKSQLDANTWLSDEYILNFWLNSCEEESNLGFKLFSSCYAELISFHQALSVSYDKINARSALPIGDNIEVGEVSADLLTHTLAQLQKNSLEIDFLSQDPKFLTKSQVSILKPIAQGLPLSKKLTLTLARVYVFGAWQAVIVQASRKKNNQLINQKLNQGPENSYQMYQVLIKGVYQQIIDTLWALLHINYQHKQAQMFTLLNHLVLDKTLLKEWQLLVSQQLTKDNNIPVLINEVVHWQLKLPELNKTFKQANRIFKSNNKTGFGSLPKLQVIDIYHEGQDVLLRLKQELTHFISHLDNLLSDKQNTQNENFRSDTYIFFNKLNSLYGVKNEA